MAAAPAKRCLMMAFVLESGRDVLDEVLTMYSDNWALAPYDHKALLRAVR